jgi:citrate/tricarballylate utilization protein
MSTLKPISKDLIQEGERVMRVCNACRYCEGYCAVFPAMERRLTFEESDLNYMANLCHNCSECYYACQYAPPQEFELNFPKTLAEIRGATYRKYAWPGFLAGLFNRNGVAVSLVTAASLALFFIIMLAFITPTVMFSAHTDSKGAFYAVLHHDAMTWPFAVVALFVLTAFFMGGVRFWRDTEGKSSGSLDPKAIGQAAWDTLRLRYLDGGGDGCAYPDDLPSHARRWFHHMTFYGFFCCFVATSLGVIYTYIFGWQAPYPFLSLPVLSGTLGGVGLLVGPVGLLWLKGTRNAMLSDKKQSGMDIGFLVLLFLSGLTGLLLLAFRETQAMGVLLGAHLGVVMGLFLTLPYGKFAHAIYRFAALVRNDIEKRTMPQLGSE